MTRTVVLEPDVPMSLVNTTSRERTTSWLRWYFAIACDVRPSHVSVVYNDDAESITVHVACMCADRHILTFTAWATSDDTCHIFHDQNDVTYRVPFEPFAGYN